MSENARLTGERPQQGVTPDSLLTLHAAGYRAVREKLGPGPLLDVGCGQGFESITLAAPDRPVIGVDYSADAVEFARSKFGGESFEVAQMDAFKLGFTAGSFQSVCSSHLIEHFHEPALHVAEMARVVADDGAVYVLTPNEPADFENPFHLHLFDAAELRTMLEEHFEEVWLGGVDAVDWVKADFAERRAKARKVLSFDVFDLRHKIPQSWYVAAYTRLLPIAYKLIARGDSGGTKGITIDDWSVTEQIDETTLVLFAVARKPRRR